MEDQFLDPKPFRGTPTEDPREWIQRVESWLSYKNYTNLPNPYGVADETEKKSRQSTIIIVRRRLPYVLELLLQEQPGFGSAG